MSASSNDVSTLNDLLATVVDSIDGFHQAGEGVDDPRIKSAFSEIVAERREVLRDLERAIHAAGGTPEEEGTILGSAHRVLMRIREVVSSGDAAVVDEAERGEDYIKGKFEKAPQDDALTLSTKDAVLRVMPRIVAGRDRISALKRSLHG